MFHVSDTSSLEISVKETIGGIVRRHARTTPDAPALLAEGRAPLTYVELARLMDRVQERLNAAGFGRSDRIATIGPSDTATAALIIGIMDGATAVPMNPDLSLGEFVLYLRDLKVQAVAVDAGIDTAARAAARKIGLPVLEVECVAGDIAGMIDIRSGPVAGPSARPGPAQPDDLALVLTTSGTTSYSKVVPVTHRQLVAKIARHAKAQKMTAADRCLSLMPLFHGHGLYTSLGSTLFSGGSVIALPEFSVEAFFRLIATLAPTWYTGSYTFHHAICAAAPDHADAIAASRLRFVKTGSGHLDPRIVEALETLFRAPVISTYASTETSYICGTPLPPAVRKPGTVGVPVDGRIAIIGPDDRLLPAGERGEVVVESTGIFDGYENDDDANEKCFVNGWFRTGDEGIIDRDGYVMLTGRIKDIINRGGEKITPSEVDGALKAHPDVADAVTFPVPHATLGQEVAAAVVPAPGAEFTDETLARFLRGRLAPFKVPRRFVIVDEIPKGATGKVQRRNLAEAFGLVTDSSRAQPVAIDNRPATALEAKLQRLWAEVLGIERVGLNEDFFMLGGDSLQAVELFLRVEKELGRRLPRSVLFEAGTAARMAQRIEETAPSPCLVPIQPKGKNSPFFCVHDGNGQVLNYRDLARFLGESQPFYGIQCRGLDGEEEPFTRIDEMAAHYVREIRKVQRVGPYYLGGYSFGGRVAYVMAQHLRAAGDDVALLALIDTYSQAGERRVSTRDWFAHHRQRVKSLAPGQVPGYLWLRARNVTKTVYMTLRVKCFSNTWRFFESRGQPLPRILRCPVPANDMIRRSYRARPYDGDAVLFKAERYAWAHADQHDGWHYLIRGCLEIRPISGRHYEIMTQPHVQTLAKELSAALAKAQTTYRDPSASLQTVISL
jgi:acyl-CoA synthetase (AMP-forming)/AMP-acid ligase II/thioesterase domain-containing protein/acyl carrier protein